MRSLIVLVFNIEFADCFELGDLRVVGHDTAGRTVVAKRFEEWTIKSFINAGIKISDLVRSTGGIK